MTAEALRENLHAAPFKPFRLRMPDGRALPVPHPDFIAIDPNGLTAVLYKENGGFWTVDLISVSDLDPGLDETPHHQSSQN